MAKTKVKVVTKEEFHEKLKAYATVRKPIDSLADISAKIMEGRVMRLNQDDARRIREAAQRVGKLVELILNGKLEE